MSSGASGISSLSSVPVRMARTSAAHSTSSSRVVAKMRPLGVAPIQCPDTADALQGHRDGSRRTDLASQVHGADVDAEFQRSRRDYGAQFAVLQPLLGVQP